MVSDVRGYALPRSLTLLAHKVKASPGAAVGEVYLPGIEAMKGHLPLVNT